MDAIDQNHNQELTMLRQQIAELEQANLHLQTENAELRSYIDQLPALINIMRGPQHRFVLANPAMREVFGNRELLGKTVRQAQPELEGQGIYELLDRVYQSGEPFYGSEVPVKIARSGEVDQLKEGYFNFIYQPYRDATGQVSGILSLAFEVTTGVLLRRQLEESREYYRALSEAIPQIVWTANPDGYVDYYNQRWYEYTGFTQAQSLLPTGWEAILHPDDVARCFSYWYGAVESGQPYNIEYRFKDRQNGGYRWFLGRAVPVRNAQGQILKWFGTCTDIDEQKRIEQKYRDVLEQLQNEQARLQAIIESVPVGIVLAQAPDGKIVLGNSQVEQIFRHPLLPSPDVDAYAEWVSYHPDGQQVKAREYPLARALEGETVRGMTVLYQKGDGTKGWIRLSGAPIRDHNGQITGSVVVALDFDQEQRAEERVRFLAAASSLLASSLDYETSLPQVADLAVPALSDGCMIALLDTERGLSLVANTQALLDAGLVARLENYFAPSLDVEALAEVVKSGRPLFLPEVGEEVLRRLARTDAEEAALKQTGLSGLIIVPLIVRDQTVGLLFWASYSGKARKFGADDLALTLELGRRIALAVDNAQLYRRATTAIKDRDLFLSVAAHELKTPVTALRGYAQLLTRQINRAGQLDPQRLIHALNVINTQSEKLTRLILQLLDLSRIETGKLILECSLTNLSQLVEEVITVLQPNAERHTLMLDTPGPIEVMVDPVRFEQVLINLVDNAVKYSPDGGPVVIQISLPDAATVALSVTDQGIGIPVETRDHIFDRFSQAHSGNQSKGIGLGLNISRQIIELHDGRIRAEFPAQGGTRIVIELPHSS